MSSTPIHVHGWDETNNYWPGLSRRCDIVISDDVWIDMNDGLSPIRPSDVDRPEV